MAELTIPVELMNTKQTQGGHAVYPSSSTDIMEVLRTILISPTLFNFVDTIASSEDSLDETSSTAPGAIKTERIGGKPAYLSQDMKSPSPCSHKASYRTCRLADNKVC